MMPAPGTAILRDVDPEDGAGRFGPNFSRAALAEALDGWSHI